MEKKKNTPKLRFPEFTGEWEEKKLGEIAEIITGNTPPTANNEYYNGDKEKENPHPTQKEPVISN